MCKLANDFNVPMRQCANVPIILGSLTAFEGRDASNASVGEQLEDVASGLSLTKSPATLLGGSTKKQVQKQSLL